MWHKYGVKGSLQKDVSWCIVMHTTEPTSQRALGIIYMMLIDLQRDAKGTH